MRANHGRPAVKFTGTSWRPAYELHGVQARDFYAEQEKALAWVRQQRKERGV